MDVYDFVKTMYPGGNQLNTAIYAKWAGADSAYLGYFSDDVRGQHLKWVLEKNKVDLTRCKVLHGQCSYAMTTLVDGNRTFHGTRKGVNAMTPIVTPIWTRPKFRRSMIWAFPLPMTFQKNLPRRFSRNTALT